MLILTRRLGETIVIGDNIKVTLTSLKGQKVGIGISAPRDVPVRRAELPAKKQLLGT